MEGSILTASEKIKFMRELLTCGDMIYTWFFNGEGMLIESNCPNQVLHTLFEHTGCKDSMIEHFERTSTPLILSSLCAILKINGYDPVSARDGQEALKIMDHQHIDLLICDVMMPRMDGFELTQAIDIEHSADTCKAGTCIYRSCVACSEECSHGADDMYIFAFLY